MNQEQMGLFVREKCIEKNISLHDFAIACEVDEEIIKEWESGNYIPTMTTLQKASDVLDVSMHEILEGRTIDAEEFRAIADQNLVELENHWKLPQQDPLAFKRRQWLLKHRLRILITFGVELVLLLICLFTHATLYVVILLVVMVISALTIWNEMSLEI